MTALSSQAYVFFDHKSVHIVAQIQGPGCKDVGEDPRVGELLRRHEKNGKYIAAICAGPTVFKKFGIAPSASITAYPAVVEELRQAGTKRFVAMLLMSDVFFLLDYKVTENDVEVHKDTIITSRGYAA